jgi:lipoprotein-anchoring transpeptidase ErfK/SrfK
MRHPSVRACLPIIAVAALAGGAGAAWPARSADAPSPRPAPARSSIAPPVRATVPKATPAPAGLPVIDYWGAPRSFPADPAPASTAALTRGLRPLSRRVVYDAPGGRPRAWLPRSISGLPVTVPIVERRPGWVAVLLPSINRRVGWLTTAGWTARPLRDQLVLRRRTHELTWFRDGARRAGWTVATGTATTPTPLGRTFVLGRTATSGSVYAGLDALALGSVPEDRASLPHALRTGHTGIHGWYSSGVFGRSVSNGCIRMPGAGQRTLLRNLAPGTPLTVLDR